jgi:hypothetical protein
MANECFHCCLLPMTVTQCRLFGSARTVCRVLWSGPAGPVPGSCDDRFEVGIKNVHPHALTLARVGRLRTSVEPWPCPGLEAGVPIRAGSSSSFTGARPVVTTGATATGECHRRRIRRVPRRRSHEVADAARRPATASPVLLIPKSQFATLSLAAQPASSMRIASCSPVSTILDGEAVWSSSTVRRMRRISAVVRPDRKEPTSVASRLRDVSASRHVWTETWAAARWARSFEA